MSNESDKRIIVGLAAIDLLASEGQLNELSAADASLATRYAVNEMNGFPEWLTGLAELHPAAVAGVLNDCVAGEIAATPKAELLSTAGTAAADSAGLPTRSARGRSRSCR